MRVAFFDPTAEELTSHTKGALFEEFAGRLAALAGYRDVRLRRKDRSLEYDVEGVSKLHARPLIGEAKAHERRIQGQELTGFIGKFLPKAWKSGAEGLFISTSPLTPEADDNLRGFLTEIEDGTPKVRFRALVGDDIPRFLIENCGFASQEALSSRVSALFELELLDVRLVVAQRGDIYACLCGPSPVSSATAVALFKTDGSTVLLPDAETSRLTAQIEELRGLEVLGRTPLTLETERSGRLPPVIAGAGWFDYRFPTPPDCFVGRRDRLAELRHAIEDMRLARTATRAIQVMSRSGVGKSSLLLKIPTELPEAVTVTIDARSLRAAGDTRLIVGEAVLAVNDALTVALAVPRSLDVVDEALRRIGEAMRESGRVVVLQVDQFESTLSLAPVFESLLDFVETTTFHALPVVWVFARKNDLATTYDESSRVDLRRLNELSHQIALSDFSRAEGQVLLSELERELKQRLVPGLAEAISTFSAGFPWLHKRLCSHVLSMHRKGVSQRDLVQAGLRAEDLFEEDLAGLDEQDKAVLRRVAAYLPATADELTAHLESEIHPARLMHRLNEFLNRKLLRRTGDIYDTYNDVFKTYVVSGQVPFEARYIYRVQPRAAYKMLARIHQLGPRQLASFQAEVGGSHVANLNRLRDLRMLGLVDPKPGWVAATPETQAAFDNGTFSELLRRRLWANALVGNVLDLVAAEDGVPLTRVTELLQAELPHLDLSDDLWTRYARTLTNWLQFASMVQWDGAVLRRRELPTDETLGGRVFYQGAFSSDAFVPSVRPPILISLLDTLREGPVSRPELNTRFGDKRAPGVIRDAVALEIATAEDGDGVRLGRQGRLLLDSRPRITERDVAQLAMVKPNVRALLDATADGPLSVEDQQAILSQFGFANWTRQTWAWRLGVLRAWLVATGQVRNRRKVGLVSVDAPDAAAESVADAEATPARPVGLPTG